ncbi:MAG TPA: hypothetical protein VLS28_11095 [Candidatus Sulfomarinibacteraceae bacterium]|nr:hypothetical protein [Candidatus Sulfomarinibacteraceae bacterium]
MSRTPRRAILLAFGLAAAMVLPSAVSANHSWGGYHWARTANPFTLKLADNVNTTWDSYLVTTSSDWSASRVLDTTIVAGTGNPRTCKATTGMVQVCNASYGYNGWLGLAGISITGGTHITKAYVKVNDSYFNSPSYNTPAWRNLVMCQEVGHTLGLDHQDEVFANANLGTCMDYTNSPDSNQHPNAHDYEQLEQIYAHLDATTTVAAVPVAAAAPLPDEAADAAWGTLVKVTNNGHGAWYVRDLGAGNMTLTHVLWADR